MLGGHVGDGRAIGLNGRIAVGRLGNRADDGGNVQLSDGGEGGRLADGSIGFPERISSSEGSTGDGQSGFCGSAGKSTDPKRRRTARFLAACHDGNQKSGEPAG